MATVPKPLSKQVNLTGNDVTLIETIPDTFTLGTASIEMINFANSAATENTIWFLPAGSTSPQNLNRIGFSPLNNKGAQFIRFGIAVGPGDRFYAQTNGQDVNVFFNAVAHPQE